MPCQETLSWGKVFSLKLKGCALWNSQNINQFLNFAPVISAPGKITSIMRRNWEATFDNLQRLKNAHIMLGKKGSGSSTFKTASASASCFQKFGASSRFRFRFLLPLLHHWFTQGLFSVFLLEQT